MRKQLTTALMALSIMTGAIFIPAQQSHAGVIAMKTDNPSKNAHLFGGLLATLVGGLAIKNNTDHEDMSVLKWSYLFGALLLDEENSSALEESLINELSIERADAQDLVQILKEEGVEAFQTELNSY